MLTPLAAVTMRTLNSRLDRQKSLDGLFRADWQTTRSGEGRMRTVVGP